MTARHHRLESAGVLVYDGDCGFCQWSITQGRRFLPVMPVVEPLQTADLAAYGLTREQALAAVQFVPGAATSTPGAGPGGVLQPPAAKVDPEHRPVAGHLAVAAVLMSQPRVGWRFAGALITVPPISFAAALAYRWVAGHRHLLPGASDACAVPSR